MKNISVVIGAGYGDEGKGLATDYLTKNKRSCAVLRFNGGAQAGHGVELVDGTRHVFHHLGSGTFNNCPTILSRHFIVNPILFWVESQDLTDRFNQMLPPICIDPRCVITTPFEMEINQALERSRGDERHGSCGVGVGETVEREERGYNLTIDHVRSGEFENILNQIRYEYFPERLHELGLEAEDIEQSLIEQFIVDVYDMMDQAEIMHDYEAVDEFENLVFEGAQGLCLDEYSKDFPHVTRSSTGLKNVAEIITDSSVDAHLSIYYITRCYTTRHGAGPLNGEIHKELDIVDKTNAPNEFQGSMRYAELDIDRIANEIRFDIGHLASVRARVDRHLFVTHCDQLHKITTTMPHEIVKALSDKTDIKNVHTSWGPTYQHVVEGCPAVELAL